MFPGRLVLVMLVVQVAHAQSDQGIQCNNEESCSSHASIDRSLLQVQQSAVKTLVDETKASGATDKKLVSAAVSAPNKAQREQAEKRVGGENLKTPVGDQEDGDMEHSQGREDKRDEDSDAEDGEEDDGGRDGDIQKMEVEMVDDGELEIETEVEDGKEDRGGKGDEDDEKNDGGHESDAPALLATDASEVGRRRWNSGTVNTNYGTCRRRAYCGFNNQARTRTRRRIPVANRRRTVPVGGNVDLRHRRRRTVTRRRILMYRGGTRRRHHCLNDNGHRVPCPAGYK